MQQEVKVTNGNAMPFSDAFHGVNYTFPVGETVAIPVEAAFHIFGFNRQDKKSAMVRLGIANHPDGAKWLNNFKMEYVKYVAKEEAEEVDDLKVSLAERDDELKALAKEVQRLGSENAELKKKLEKYEG